MPCLKSMLRTFETKINVLPRHQWTCTKSGYQDSGTCSKAKPTSSCGSNKYTCQNNGTVIDEGESVRSNQGYVFFTWKCQSSDGVISDECRKQKTPSLCNNTTKKDLGSLCTAFNFHLYRPDGLEARRVVFEKSLCKNSITF